jgi:hypothetical protein
VLKLGLPKGRTQSGVFDIGQPSIALAISRTLDTANRIVRSELFAHCIAKDAAE